MAIMMAKDIIEIMNVCFLILQMCFFGFQCEYHTSSANVKRIELEMTSKVLCQLAAEVKTHAQTFVEIIEFRKLSEDVFLLGLGDAGASV
jgi:hypothetical protein